MKNSHCSVPIHNFCYICLFSYALENCPGDTIDKITTSEHDGGYSLNYEARQNASKLNQAVKTINAFEKRTESCQYHRAKGQNLLSFVPFDEKNRDNFRTNGLTAGGAHSANFDKKVHKPKSKT